MTAALQRWIRLDLMAGLLGGVTWLVAALFSGNAALPVPLALGAPILAAQFVAQRRNLRSEQERDEILPIIEAALPKLKVGFAVDEAFLQASAQAASPSALAVGDTCRRAADGTLRAREKDGQGPMLSALLALIAAAREQGGDVARPFEGFAVMLQGDQRLRRKQQLSTVQIRRQANVLVLVALLILAASMTSSQEALVFLFRDARGRILVILSATLFVWGQVALNVLTARIADV